jgi:hypothetical protein
MPRDLLQSAKTGAAILLGNHTVPIWSRTPVILTDVFMVLCSVRPGKLRDRNLVKQRLLLYESFRSVTGHCTALILFVFLPLQPTVVVFSQPGSGL